MKKILVALLCLSPILMAAQNVGIGTPNPDARLQINHGNTTAIGLKLLDSANSRAGIVRFQNLSNTVGIYMSGYYETNFNRDQYLDITSDSSFIATFRGNGFVGIRNGGPQYPLDVNGDINTSGAIRANGNAGTDGQVLRSNGDGTMEWNSICDYNNRVTFISTPGSPWTVPAGITKIMIELWGAGGGSTAYGGGGGGGYIRAWLNVTPGDNLTITIGTGGTGGTSSASNGSPTNVVAPVGTFTAFGGSGSNYSAPQVSGGGGGGYSFPAGFSSYYGIRGAAGTAQQFEFYQVNPTTFYESIHSGKGGHAGNFNNAANGSIVVFNTTAGTIVRYSLNEGGKLPGGGAGPGYAIMTGGGSLGGGIGAVGMVMIHY